MILKIRVKHELTENKRPKNLVGYWNFQVESYYWWEITILWIHDSNIILKNVLFFLRSGQSESRFGSMVGYAKRKEGLQLRRWNLNICKEKVDAKFWLAETTLVMTWSLMARVASMFVYIRARFHFALIGGNWRGNGGGIQIPETLNFCSNFCDFSSYPQIKISSREWKLPQTFFPEKFTPE